MLVILTTSEPKIADQNPATMKLSSIEATRPNMAAFSTKRKRPSVMIVIGRVSKNATGADEAINETEQNGRENNAASAINSHAGNNCRGQEQAQ